MIKHIVMWKFKDFAEGNPKEYNLKFVKSSLEALIPVIPEIKTLEVGININDSDMSYDAVLSSEFASEHDLETYQNHPMHKKISEFVSKVRISRAVVDYTADSV